MQLRKKDKMYKPGEEELIKWFKETFKARTEKLGTKNADINDVLVEYRVRWSEIWQKAVEFGIVKKDNKDLFDFRLRWDEIMPKKWVKKIEKKRDAKWCERMLKLDDGGCCSIGGEIPQEILDKMKLDEEKKEEEKRNE